MRIVQTGDKDFDPARLASGSGRWLLDLRSDQGGHWVAWLDDAGAWLAAARVCRAERSAFAELSALPTARLDQAIALEAAWLSSEADAAALLPGLLYTALRAGRVWGRNALVAYVEHLDHEVAKLTHLVPLDRAPGATLAGRALVPAAQSLQVALHFTSQACSERVWSAIRPTLTDEIVAHVERWMESFLSGSWATAIRGGTISREQYVASLQNMHHYVRQTTRHIARCISCSADRRLRNHYIEHLKGEINHEVTIERDLKHLGVDPHYVIHHSVPSSATREFQAIQESVIGYHQDPVLMMACPLAAEGITAHITKEFLAALEKAVASWGVSAPERAMSFLSSHTDYDGGENGHFARTVGALRHHLPDEAAVRRFLLTLSVATDTLERSFNSAVDENRLFSTTL